VARGQVVEVAQDRQAQLVQPGVGQLLLELGSGRPQDRAARRLRRRVVEHRGLADARLAHEHQRTAAARTGGGREPGDAVLLDVPPDEPVVVEGR
jgi:hypothetical protein